LIYFRKINTFVDKEAGQIADGASYHFSFSFFNDLLANVDFEKRTSLFRTLTNSSFGRQLWKVMTASN
jgi:hypothetical protein